MCSKERLKTPDTVSDLDEGKIGLSSLNVTSMASVEGGVKIFISDF